MGGRVAPVEAFRAGGVRGPSKPVLIVSKETAIARAELR